MSSLSIAITPSPLVPCPVCGKDVATAYELHRELVIAFCSDPACRAPEGSGDQIKEAVANFLTKAGKVKR